MIYIIAPDFIELPVESYGGIERVVTNLAQGFINLNCDVKVLCKTNDRVKDEFPFLIDLSKITAGDLESNKYNFRYHSDSYVNNIISYIDNYVNEDDIIFLNHIEQKVFIPSIEKKKARFHEIVHYRNTAMRKKLVFPSKLYKSIHLKSGVVIPHPTSKDDFFPTKQSRLVEGEYLLCVGRICQNKRTHLAVKIAKRLNLKCVLAGPIHDDHYAKSFLDDVIYLGNLTSSELRNLYTYASVTACLTNCVPPETFGLFQVEALLCGSLVVSSALGGLRDTCNEYGVVKYRDYLPFEHNIKNIEKALSKYDLDKRGKSIQYTVENFTNTPVARLYLDRIINR
ncbi:glycosyltransferase [Vibrio sp. AK197]